MWVQRINLKQFEKRNCIIWDKIIRSNSIGGRTVIICQNLINCQRRKLLLRTGNKMKLNKKHSLDLCSKRIWVNASIPSFASPKAMQNSVVNPQNYIYLKVWCISIMATRRDFSMQEVNLQWDKVNTTGSHWVTDCLTPKPVGLDKSEIPSLWGTHSRSTYMSDDC